MTAASTITRSVGMNPSTPQNLGASHLRVDALIDAAIAEQRIVGAVVLVAREGELVYRRAAALADRLDEKSITVRPE
jgi:CubicO group peptidase (beta-lactamase class C family)